MAKYGKKFLLKKCKKGVDILRKMSIMLSVDGRKPDSEP